MVPTAHSREPELDILRGIAILLAMGWHFNHGSFNSALVALMWPGARFGWAGVDLFFVLSGFLVGGLLIRELESTGHIDYRRFFIRRAFRLWPVLYLFLLGMLVSGEVRPEDFFWQIALHVQNYTGTKSATHLWSLAVEEHFYILLALLFSVIAGLINRWSILVWVLCVAIILSPIVRFLGLQFGSDPGSIQIETHFRLDGLALGVLLAYLLYQRLHLFKKIQGNKGVLIFVIGLGIITIAVNNKYSVVGATIGYSAAAFASAAALILAHRSNVQRYLGIVGRFMIFLGLLSYPLYLLHVPAGHVTERIAAKVGLHGSPLIISQYAVSILVAWVVSKALERPMIYLRDRLFPRVSGVEVLSMVKGTRT